MACHAASSDLTQCRRIQTVSRGLPGATARAAVRRPHRARWNGRGSWLRPSARVGDNNKTCYCGKESPRRRRMGERGLGQARGWTAGRAGARRNEVDEGGGRADPLGWQYRSIKNGARGPVYRWQTYLREGPRVGPGVKRGRLCRGGTRAPPSPPRGLPAPHTPDAKAAKREWGARARGWSGEARS